MTWPIWTRRKQPSKPKACAPRDGRAMNESPTFEALEPREMLSGVTIITHGYQPTSSDRPGWLDTMADAIVERAGDDTAVYALRIDRSGPGGKAQVKSFNLLAGLPPSMNSNGETVIMLDWADASGLVGSYTNTAKIAELVTPYLTNAIPTQGIFHPLAESPIHLIGHSRGASVVSQLAGRLGVQGIWVDQVTTLDPHPVSPDPFSALASNVVFADNYYQEDDWFTYGYSVTGSFEADLTLVVPDHSQIHAYYHGTIDIDAVNDGDNTGLIFGPIAIKSSWYSHAVPLTGPRDAIGYHYSRIGGGSRFDGVVSAGLHPLFGLSNAFRVPLDMSNATWPSLILVELNDSDLTYTAGDLIHPIALFTDADSIAAIGFYLDQDTNPYNDNKILLGYGVYPATDGVVYSVQPEYSTAGAAPGTYHVYAKIVDPGARTRYLYSSSTIEILASPDPVDPLPPVDPPFFDPPPSNPQAGANAPLVTIKATDKTASETGGGTPAGRGTFTVTRDGATNEPLTVHYSFAGTAANDGSDYALPPGFVTIPTGAKSAVIHIDPVDDAIAEGPETVILTLAASSDYRLGATAQRAATVTIADNESTVSITATGKKATEATPAGKPGKVRIARAGKSLANPLTVNYTIGGTAQNGVDYATLSGTATIPAGQKFIDVFITPIDDAVAEDVETVVITLANDSSYNSDAKKTTATVTIADNEPVVTIKATDKAATEKDGGALSARGVFTITRKGGSTALPLAVNYSVAGTATAGDDYAALSGTAVIPAGAKSVIIVVNPIDDIITEPAETVIVTLNADASYRLGKEKERTATVTIADFELAPASIAGLAFNAKITQGTLTFAVKGSTGQWIASDAGDRYIVIGGKGVRTSQGEYTYEKLTSTTALLTFNDAISGQAESTWMFTNPTRMSFSTTNQAGGMQTGTMTMLKPAASLARSSLAGRTANAKISSGVSPFASKGDFLASFNNNGFYNIFGGPGVANSNGAFTYTRFNANTGLLSLTNSSRGDYWSVLTFITLSKVNYVSVHEDTLAVQRGTMSIF